MKKHIAMLISFLVISVTAFSQTYSNSNLNGIYYYQVSSTQYKEWYKTFDCTYNGHTYIYAGGGFVALQVATNGFLQFDGIGDVTGGLFTITGQFNQIASNNTVKITFDNQCNPTINNGHAVFSPPTTPLPCLGSYNVNSDGTGTLTLAVSGKYMNFTFQLAGANPSNGISNTVLLMSITTTGTNKNKLSTTGVAVHQ